jgi:hypothetical protein
LPRCRPAAAAFTNLQANHRKFAVAETEGRVAGRGEAEQRVGPVMDAEDAFLIEIAHVARSDEGRPRGKIKNAETDCLAKFHLYTNE